MEGCSEDFSKQPSILKIYVSWFFLNLLGLIPFYVTSLFLHCCLTPGFKHLLFDQEVVARFLHDIFVILLVVTGELRVNRHSVFTFDEVPVGICFLHVAIHEFHQ